MSIITEFTLPLLLISIGLNLILILLVFQSNRKSATNTIFIVLGLVVSVWLLTMYFANHPTLNIFWSRMSIVFAMPLSFSFLLLAHTLPSEKLLMKNKYLYSLIFITLIISAINFSPFAFTHIEIIDGISRVVAGPGMLPFSLVSTVFSLYAIYKLFIKLRVSSGVEKKQIELVLLGMLAMLGLIIVTILIPVVFFKNEFFVSFAPVYALIFLTATAISILKYHLFDIKIIATEALVSVLIIALLIEGVLSGSVVKIILKSSFAFFIGAIGLLLVRSVKKEIKQKEELAQLAESLERANLRLQELDKQKTEFLSIASHQLRTPLSILKGYIELIADGAYGKVDKKTKNVLGDMDVNNEHLIKLVDEFLNITRLEQGRAKYEFSSVYIPDLIDNIVKDFKIKVAEKNIKIFWEKPKEFVEVGCDKEKIHNVIFNFVDNALKYSERGEIKVVLNIENKGISLKVQDQGIGFKKEDEVNFYQKFYRGENVKASNVSGTGLGLYVCRKFIEAHNGRVWAHSDGLGKGSEFGFWIPLTHVV